MPHKSRRRRAKRAGLVLAVVLAVGFAADAVVLLTTRARADAESTVAAPERDHRSALAAVVPRMARRGGSDTLAIVTVGITLVLAVCGAIIAAGRRFMPQGAGAGMQVVGRVSLSPKHAVYMLRVGQRVLVVGVGPQGAPALISELDELVEIEPDPHRGEKT